MKVSVRTVGPFRENSYLIVDDAANVAVLVDPGDEPEALVAMVQASGATLDAIWCTHAHLDHIGGIVGVRRQYPVPVHLHPLDLPFFRQLSARAAEMYGVPFEQPECDVTSLADGQEMRCGSLSFTVVHVPGHSPGQVSFNGHGAAFSGDLLFAGSIGRTDLPLSDPVAMDASLERFARLPRETVVYPGHGAPTSIGAERQSNPFLSGHARTVKR